jgi:hypothetical protein
MPDLRHPIVGKIGKADGRSGREKKEKSMTTELSAGFM